MMIPQNAAEVGTGPDPMSDDPAEVPLSGGRVTPGVVRVGETVRRPATANSGIVRLLLQHLAARGFESAPDYLGTDDRGRDVLGFIPGEVPADLGFHDDAALVAAARLIRRFHDLGAELIASSAADGVEVVCHNDLSPCNFVFRDSRPVAMIDFDAAAPGTRARDLGYAAWLWLDIGSPENDAPEQARRLRVFLGAYGMDAARPVVAAMLERQAELATEGRQNGNAAMADWAGRCRDWTKANLPILAGD